MLVTRDESFLLKRCKYCRTEQPETSFEVCRIIKGVVDRRLRCNACKKAMVDLRNLPRSKTLGAIRPPRNAPGRLHGGNVCPMLSNGFYLR